MKKIIIYLLLFVLVGISLFSCKSYKDEFYGPGLGVAPDDFTASPIAVSNANPNFSTQTVSFQSTFNATVRWKITLVGQTSGAIKFINGLSSSLDASNSIWDGSTDTLKLFRKSETVVATLTVLGWKESISTSFVIAGEKN